MITLGIKDVIAYGENGRPEIPLPWFCNPETNQKLDRFYDEFCENYHKLKEKGITFPVDVSTLTAQEYWGLNCLAVNPLGCVSQYIKTQIKPYKECIASKEKFAIGFSYQDTIVWDPKVTEFPDDLVDAIHKGQCKVICYCYSEPHPRYNRTLDWLYNLACKYGLTKDSFVIISANLDLIRCVEEWEKHSHKKLSATFFPTCAFEYQQWFRQEDADLVGIQKPEKHFTCLSRRASPERVYLTAFLEQNYKDKSYISLGDPYHFFSDFEGFADHCAYVCTLPKMRTTLRKYFRENSLNLLRVLDDTDKFQTENHAGDLSLYLGRSFVNICVETMPIDLELPLIFFSEKIFKPIACKRPFILYGNYKSLEKLHEMGYETFGQWWDESYDLIEDPIRRLQAVSNTIEQVASFSLEDLHKIYESSEMQKILEHNREVYQACVRGNKHVFELETFIKGKTSIKKNLI